MFFIYYSNVQNYLSLVYEICIGLWLILFGYTVIDDFHYDSISKHVYSSCDFIITTIECSLASVLCVCRTVCVYV